MNRQTFFAGIEKIFLTFNRKVPSDDALNVIYERINKLPDSFMPFVVAHYQDQEDLPKNISRHILRELWPEYLSQHPELVHKRINNCALCKDNPGWRTVYTPLPNSHPTLVRCICGFAPNPKHEQPLTDEQLLAAGFLLKRPYNFELPDFLKRRISGVGVDEPPRKDHVEYMRKYESLENDF